MAVFMYNNIYPMATIDIQAIITRTERNPSQHGQLLQFLQKLTMECSSAEDLPELKLVYESNDLEQLVSFLSLRMNDLDSRMQKFIVQTTN